MSTEIVSEEFRTFHKWLRKSSTTTAAQWRAGTRANYSINLLIWFVTFKSVKSDRDTIGSKNQIKSWRFGVMDESGDDVMVAAHCGRLRNYSCLCSALLCPLSLSDRLFFMGRSSKYVKQALQNTVIWTWLFLLLTYNRASNVSSTRSARLTSLHFALVTGWLMVTSRDLVLHHPS